MLKTNSRKLLITILSILIVLSLCSPSFAAEKNFSNIYGVADLSSSSVYAVNLSFSEMTEEISESRDISREQVIDDMISNVCLEDYNIRMISSIHLQREKALEKLNSTNFLRVTIGVGAFPVFQSKYQPTGVIIYGEGYTKGARPYNYV